ncbi:hypothetical protein MMF93_18935 [Streptomyces tubbatahanensis]|uniref:DUF3558 domain-containing protein n=1 Tax=Streptomyces tubbatahanensis TaxID=2923272 RepID=A0ABY3XV73_9ACTN|nr:hypothetical protein [Streptomyces tubbatahanensis]UNS98297.1 hypothetical protein MMF93_18935 [Streptomyces tubbatahanensis]
MPRRAKRDAVRASYATKAALALVLAGALTACTGSSDSEDGNDGKPGGSSASPSAAEPGKYSTLPEPCDAVGTGTLRDLLPGAAAAEEDGTAAPSPSADPYEGEPSATYDTDRRVGCGWKNATTLSTRHLNIDFERVVSYDPSVSDDEQAAQLYVKKARKAHIPLAPGDGSTDSGAGADSDAGAGSDSDSGKDPDASGEPEKSGGKTPEGHASPTEEPGKGHESDGAGGTGGADEHGKGGSGDDGGKGGSGEDGGEDGASDSPGSDTPTPDEDLAPRSLDDLADAAYIDDELHTADSGIHRDVTLVFRTANVIATVEYDQWVTDKHRIPDSEELQEKARKLAGHLAEQFED